MIYGLDLFSGIGGMSLALSQWVKTIAYCEIDPYAQTVILENIARGRLDNAPIWDDITTLKGDMLPDVDIIFGGFPCQDISVAGNERGLAGERSGLYWELYRLVMEKSPRWVFLENVRAIRTSGLSDIIRSFADLGFESRWTCVSANEIGAPHLRKRWFGLFGNTDRIGSGQVGQIQSWADTDVARNNEWTDKPDVDRMDDGFPYRVDRARVLGNAVVPMQAKTAFERLIGYE